MKKLTTILALVAVCMTAFGDGFQYNVRPAHEKDFFPYTATTNAGASGGTNFARPGPWLALTPTSLTDPRAIVGIYLNGTPAGTKGISPGVLSLMFETSVDGKIPLVGGTNKPWVSLISTNPVEGYLMPIVLRTNVAWIRWAGLTNNVGTNAYYITNVSIITPSVYGKLP